MRLLLTIVLIIVLQVLLASCVSMMDDLDVICEDSRDCRGDEKCVYMSSGSVSLCKPENWCDHDHPCYGSGETCDYEAEECV